MILVQFVIRFDAEFDYNISNVKPSPIPFKTTPTNFPDSMSLYLISSRIPIYLTHSTNSSGISIPIVLIQYK